MAQPAPGDFPIDPTTTSGDVLADILNRQFEWINTTNSGPTPPARTFPGQLWLDTSIAASPNGVLRMRNNANNAWIQLINSASVVDFTPVRQGTGPGQGANVVSIGWSASLGKVLVSVDNNGFANKWPIDIDGTARGIRSGGAAAGSEIRLNWADPGTIPAYLHGGNSPTDAVVVPPSRLSVNYAVTSTNAGNADAVNGISGWAYSNHANNPAYLWATEGSGGAQHLTQPGNLSVNYANSANYATSAGTANYANSVGTANNANYLRGREADYWLNNADTAIRNLRNNSYIQIIAGVAGIGDIWWPTNLSDERLKVDIADTADDSVEKIMRIRFRQFRFRGDLAWQNGDFDPPNHPLTIPSADGGRLHTIGVIAQEVETIDPEWVSDAGSYKAVDTLAMLMDACHAIQQLVARVQALEGAEA